MLPLIVGVGVAVVGTGINYFSSRNGNREARIGNREARIGNRIGIIGLVIGVATSIITSGVMLWAFMPEGEEEFDVKNYYEDGVLHFTGNGTVENKEDTWKWYSQDGILIKIETYDDNELDGVYKEFYKNGNLKIDGEYDDGERNFYNWKCFNLDGSSQKCKDIPLPQKEKSFLDKTKSFFSFSKDETVK